MALTSGLADSVFGAAVLLAGFALVGIAMELPAFADPCHSWGMGQAGNGTNRMTLSPDDDCSRRSGSSETRAEAALRLVLVDGTAIVAAALAAMAAWRRHAPGAFAAGLLMAGEVVVLFFGLSIAFLFALASSILFLVAAVRWRKGRATISDGL